MLDRHNRIYEKKDYNSLYRTGRRIAGKYIIVFIRDNSLERNRFGFVCSKKVGKAVVRN
ncbi:MAG TPA: ribonuclease P protein component, partial [Syntrophomonadaceae bacterium]|nr:ribonuclease P protein component [Syntrophomonadaceae bacterium]